MNSTQQTKNSCNQQESEQIKDQFFSCINQVVDQNNEMFTNMSQQPFNCIPDQSNLNQKQDFYIQNYGIQQEISENSKFTSSESNTQSKKKSGKGEKDVQDPKTREKLQKNKMSAKKSRERKKLLVSQLEQKVQNLEKELKLAREEAEKFKQIVINLHIDYEKLENIQYKTNLVLQKIEECLANPGEHSDFQLQLISDSLLLRKTTSSVLYKNNNELLLKAMINTIFTPLIRHVLYIGPMNDEEIMQISWVKKSEACQKLIKVMSKESEKQIKQLLLLKADIEKNLLILINSQKQLLELTNQYQYIVYCPNDKFQSRDQAQLFFDLLKNGLKEDIQKSIPSKLFSCLEGSTVYDMPEDYPEPELTSDCNKQQVDNIQNSK